jgi:hypothetical protein
MNQNPSSMGIVGDKPRHSPSKTNFVGRDEGRIYVICSTTILLLALIGWIADTIVGSSSTTMNRKIGAAARHAMPLAVRRLVIALYKYYNLGY